SRSTSMQAMHAKPGRQLNPPLPCMTVDRTGFHASPSRVAAAHYDTNFLPQGLRAESFDPWVQALENSGRKTSDKRVGIIRSILVTDDKERDWPMVRAAERYRMELYNRFFKESGEGFGARGEPVPQTWIVGDVEHCVEQLKAFVEDFGMTDIVSMAVPPGLRTEQMSVSLESLFTEVVPRLKEALRGA
ncbi:MAG: hypothetical protein AAF529_05270, partial [Pseudomonadota bacterium]